MTKGKTRKEKKRLVFISLTIVALLVYLVSSVYTDFLQISSNKKESSTLSSEYESLLKQNDSLKSEITKMKDPDYVARYAKEKYLYSSKGEIIIRID